jgi:dihydrofolate reductase
VSIGRVLVRRILELGRTGGEQGEAQMSRLVVTMFTTLDGVAQAPGGPDEDRDGGFEHGGWFVPHFTEDMGAVICDWFARADAFLLGRRTYEIFASHWPHITDPDDPVATALNTLPKFVASRTLARTEWEGATVMQGDVVEVVKRLKAMRDGELQVHGSPGFVQTLMKHDLVDEYRIWVAPVVVGGGKRLFGEGALPVGMKLVETKASTSGVVMCRYEHAGAPVYGAMGLDTETPAE